MRPMFVVVCLSLLVISGCVISPRRTTSGGGGGGGGGTSTGGQLYVSTGNSILRFANSGTSNGNVTPTATITGSSTRLASAQRLFVDTSADRLYVANRGGSSILVFDNASTLTGNAQPTRVISGGLTTLSAPVDVAVDTTNNLLYVADGTSVLIFTSASTVSGNIAPASSVNMGVTVTGILSDGFNNQLYFADSGDDSVDRLDSASTQSVIGIIGGAIAGPDTKLSQPSGLALDGSGRLIVSNSASPLSVTIYPNASIATGDVLPVATITSTRLQSPGQIALNRNVNNGELYVADTLAASVLVFTNISTATGNLTPARAINGTSTGLVTNAVNGLAVDPTR